MNEREQLKLGGTKHDARLMTDEQVRLFESLYSHTFDTELARLFGCATYSIRKNARILNLEKQPDFLRLRQRLCGMKGALKKFSSGNLDRLVALRAEYQIPDSFYVYLNNGFLRVTDAQRTGSQSLHNIIWRRHRGEIPKNHIVTFKDGNRLNCHVENLELISNSERSIRAQLTQYPKELHSVVEVLIELKKTIKAAEKTRRKESSGGNRYESRTHAAWTDEEVLFLKTNYRKRSNRDIAQALNRPIHSVTTMAFRLELTGRRGCGKKLFWTKENIQKIKRDYARVRRSVLADALGCSIPTVFTKAKELGLTRRNRRLKNQHEVQTDAEK